MYQKGKLLILAQVFARSWKSMLLWTIVANLSSCANGNGNDLLISDQLQYCCLVHFGALHDTRPLLFHYCLQWDSCHKFPCSSKYVMVMSTSSPQTTSGSMKDQAVLSTTSDFTTCKPIWMSTNTHFFLVLFHYGMCYHQRPFLPSHQRRSML